MTSIGVPRLVVSEILYHVEQGVTAGYDRHSCDADKHDALVRWDRRLRQLLSKNRHRTAQKVVDLAALREAR